MEEVSGTTRNQGSSKKSQRKRKSKSYGKDFKENDDTEESDNSEENNSSTCSPVLKETNGPGNKAKCKKVSNKLAEKEKGKKRKSSAQKERELNISSQHDELVITQILGGNPAEEPHVQAPETAEELLQVPQKVPLHPHFGGKQPKQHKPPKCISVICREEKDEMKGQLTEIRNELERTKEELNTLKALQPSTTAIDSIKYGKVPQSMGMTKNWEEILNGVWCCPVKVKAAIRTSATRTALVLTLFPIFYPKEEIKGRRLHKLDQDIIEAITDFSLVAKLTKEPVLKKTKDGEEKKLPSPVSRSGIKQALWMKCNSLISLQRRKGEETAAAAAGTRETSLSS